MKTFYVCSYGGCGSKMLCSYLKRFGTTKHIHSRKPPEKLAHIDTKPGQIEWFNPDNPIPEDKLSNYTVIYLYRNPVNAIYSRFRNKNHLKNIQINPEITLNQVIQTNKDLYEINNFFDNYTTPNPNRNYKIYCVKYEGFFNNLEQFNKTFNLPDNKNKYPKEKITKKQTPNQEKLYKIYSDLIHKMQNMDFIQIV